MESQMEIPVFAIEPKSENVPVHQQATVEVILLGLRPIFHQKAPRIEAHLFVAFLAYCLSVTLRQQLKAHAPGLMPRVVFEKLATVQMLDVCVPTTDGRELLLVRHTEPSTDVQLLLERLGLTLPPQPPPKIRSPATQSPL
jgi:hypothetical protein